ncbi:unnamed protein product [Polarella glacialis]|uniref:PDZ domain-containing protein n=1 Tax=Polarella glacialis TaxID=89957 RepID=A0A813HTC7_POLGL|nr:unnamed protein product [Polarella glacialis]
MGQWIGAKLIGPGKMPGLLDLDCKEGAELRRIRLPPSVGDSMGPLGVVGSFFASMAGYPSGGSSAATMLNPLGTSVPSGMPLKSALKHHASSSSTATACGASQQRGPPLSPDDHCFYHSETHGWITARIAAFRPETGCYDLDVKKGVPPAKVHGIRAGSAVEYHSTSLPGTWVPARVLRPGANHETFDLDCKECVPLDRLRPPADGAGEAGISIPRTNPAAHRPDGTALLTIPRTNAAAHRPDGTALLTIPRTDPGAHIPDGYMSVATSPKLHQLRASIHAKDPVALRQRLESNSDLRAGHVQSAVHRLDGPAPRALAELRRAIRNRNKDLLAAAIEAAALAGVPDEELENGAQALQDLEEPMWRYDPDDHCHMDIRAVPMINGSRTQHALLAGEVFRVSTEHRGADGTLYLKLADGRGWVFDRKPGAGTLCVRYEVARFTVISVENGIQFGLKLSSIPMNRVAVSQVDPGGWADRLGVKPGDELLAVAAQRVSKISMGELEKVVAGKGPRPLALTFACKEDGPGNYTIVHDGSAVTPTVALGSDTDIVAQLSAGTKVIVSEIVNNDKEQRIRGRIARPAGWISLLNTENGKRWARKQH